MDDTRSRSEKKPAAGKPASPGVGTPVAGESSSSNMPVPPLDSDATIVDARRDLDATIVDAGPGRDPDATLVDADTTIALGTSVRRTSAPPSNRRAPASDSTAVFQIGQVVGGRYEILQLLGEGGMGAVYKAADRALDRFVALKVIRSEMASNPAILARFKQELLLSHQVTHRNVIRIYDLGEADGVAILLRKTHQGVDVLRPVGVARRRRLGARRSDSAGVSGAGCGAQRRDHSSRPEAAKYHAGSGGANPGDGFRIGPNLPGRWDDPNRRDRRHHGVHVAGAGSGRRARSTFRHLRARSDFLRNADGQDALCSRERSGQPHQTDPDAPNSGIEY